MTTKLAVFSLRFMLFMVAEYLFFTLAPWATCRPLSDLSIETVPHGEIPTYAQCYYVNHGQVVFRGHPTVAEDPARFVFFLVLFFLLIGIFFWSGRWSRRNLYGETLGMKAPNPDLRLDTRSAGSASAELVNHRSVFHGYSGLLGRFLIAAILVTAPLALIAVVAVLREGLGIFLFGCVAIAATAGTGLPSRKSKKK